MRTLGRRMRITIAFLFLAFAAAGISTAFTSINAEAATANGFVSENGSTYYYKDGKKATGFVTVSGKTYYFKKDGKQLQGWLRLKGKRYFFAHSSKPANRYMATGWKKDDKGVLRYFNSKGVMATGWKTINNKTYYFDEYGVPAKGWMTQGKSRCYFNKDGVLLKNKTLYDSSVKGFRFVGAKGRMVRGWYKGKTCTRYYSSAPNDFSKDGLMVTGFQKIGSKTYYFSTDKKNLGYLMTGWVTRKSDGAKFYMDPNHNGAMLVNMTINIKGTEYVFDKNGVATATKYQSQGGVSAAGSERTIKNYLKNALQPVGACLYVWGGWGHGTTKGVPSEWKTFYDSQNSSYNYKNHMFERSKGLDCSGFVGWAAYQIMQTKSNVGGGYTVVSGSVGPTYVSRGWGTIISQSKLAADNYKIYPGDIGYDDGHTWIMLGQCNDGSCVVLHSTNNAGVQLAGTPTPGGNYASQAVALAEKYMARYPGYQKNRAMYHTSTGQFIKRGNFLRWNRSTLADPDGYLKMTADQILADLYK